MTFPQSTAAPEVLATQLGHVRETVDRIEKKLDSAASKEEVAELRARFQVLWDERTGAKAIVGLVALIGVGNLVALVRWAMTQP